jgi:hypothetical protein
MIDAPVLVANQQGAGIATFAEPSCDLGTDRALGLRPAYQRTDHWAPVLKTAQQLPLRG